jgi:hypothetical protein
MRKLSPHPAVNGLKVSLDAYLKLFREVCLSVYAFRKAAGELIPGFEESYSRHHKDADQKSTNSPNPQQLARALRDFDQLTTAILELYEKA